jgi:hypothetical protein
MVEFLKTIDWGVVFLCSVFGLILTLGILGSWLVVCRLSRRNIFTALLAKYLSDRFQDYSFKCSKGMVSIWRQAGFRRTIPIVSIYVSNALDISIRRGIHEIYYPANRKANHRGDYTHLDCVFEGVNAMLSSPGLG